MTNNIKKLTVLIFILFFGAITAIADGSYKNELTKVSLSSVGRGDVKITLYMAKPYSEPLRLLKKNDGEFVLILPETYTSAPQKPSISDVIGEVTDADVRLYSFVSSSTQNGYTKIVIKTNGLINLYPEAVTSGGGTLVNNAQQEHYKVAKNDTPVSAANNGYIQKTIQSHQNNQATAKPAQQQKDVSKTTTAPVTQPKAEPQKPVIDVKKTDIPDVKSEELPILKLPKMLEQKTKTDIDVPFEEVVEEPVAETEEDLDDNVEKTVEENNTEVKQPNPIVAYISRRIHRLNRDGYTNPLALFVLFGAMFVLGVALKVSKSIIKSAKPEENELLKDEFTFEEDNHKYEKEEKEESEPEYSNFFKTLIESEVKGDNPFTLEQTENTQEVICDMIENEVTPIKSHEEVLNEDQNLTWQEKFRALQNNKKALLKEEHEDEITYEQPHTQENTEITEDMHIENPIKKLKQDFKAVRNVLARQKAKQKGLDYDPEIEQEFTPEKIDKIEVISFEDFQRGVSRPKVKVNGVTAPIKAKPPKVLTQLQLGDKKGFYLVDYRDKISLIGYINDKVFKLNSCDSVRNTKLYARLTEKAQNGAETYIVKFDNNKMLVDVTDSQMKLKLMY